MRQRDAIQRMSGIFDGELLADRLRQRTLAHELRDRELADRQHQAWAQQRDLAAQPLRAGLDLIGRGHTITALRLFPRETAAHRGKIKPVAHLVLRPAKRLVEPLEKCLPCGPGERSTELRLLIAGSLADEQNGTRHRTPHHHGFEHARATFAAAQGAEVFFDFSGGRHGETTPPAPGWGNKKGEARKPRPNLRCRFA